MEPLFIVHKMRKCVKHKLNYFYNESIFISFAITFTSQNAYTMSSIVCYSKLFELKKLSCANKTGHWFTSSLLILWLAKRNKKSNKKILTSTPSYFFFYNKYLDLNEPVHQNSPGLDLYFSSVKEILRNLPSLLNQLSNFNKHLLVLCVLCVLIHHLYIYVSLTYYFYGSLRTTVHVSGINCLYL